ncbi:hypothetical protein PLESTF_000890300 [Pleodorina starrii]|nr:hypothetical protein PLESTF_000890300 [Pleodorina starrii]
MEPPGHDPDPSTSAGAAAAGRTLGSSRLSLRRSVRRTMTAQSRERRSGGGGGGAEVPEGFVRVAHEVTGTAVPVSGTPTRPATPPSPSPPGSFPGSPPLQQQQQRPYHSGVQRPSYEYELHVHAGAGTATAAATTAAAAGASPGAWAGPSRGGGGGGVSGSAEGGARAWWQRDYRTPFAGPLAEALEESPAVVAGARARLRSIADPRVIDRDANPIRGPYMAAAAATTTTPSSAGGGGGGGGGGVPSSFTFAVPPAPPSGPSSGSYAPSEGAASGLEVPPLVSSLEPRGPAVAAAAAEPPFKPRPRKNAFDQAAELEEEAAFFQRLHDNRTWAVFSRGPRRQRHLLRRLGLHPGEPTSIRATVEALADILAVQQQRAAHGPMGVRSPAPDPQAPPTLAPSDPLCLSPLEEAPFLFVLQQQQLYGNADGGGGGGAVSVGSSDGRGGGGGEALEILTGRRARAESNVRSGLLKAAAYGNGGGGGGGSSTTAGMRSAYLRAFLESRTDATEELMGGPAVELWERLVGRLAARLAHKRLKRLLYWVAQELAFSEGCEERVKWVSEEELVESDPEAPPQLDWSFARCARTLVALVTQMADPAPPDEEGVGGRYPPEVAPHRPRSATDMMYWIRYEIKSYTLDWSVGILYEMTGLSEEAQALGRYEHEDIVLQVLRQLPPELLHQFVRRTFLRLSCFVMGYAELYGVARQQSLAALVTAFRYGSVLLALVRSVKSCAAVLADEFFLELYYLFRTDQVQERLREVRAGKDALLAESTQHLFEAVLQVIGDAAELQGGGGGRGGGGAAGGTSDAHLTNRAALTKMPGRIT